MTKQNISKLLLITYIVNSRLINNESAIINVRRFSNGEYLVRCICQMQLASPSNLKYKNYVYSTNQLVHTKIITIHIYNYQLFFMNLWNDVIATKYQDKRCYEILFIFELKEWFMKIEYVIWKATRENCEYLNLKELDYFKHEKTWSCGFYEDATLFANLILSTIWRRRVI